jgi:tRNA(Ile)-lysidine synthase
MTAPGARSPAADSPPPELVARFKAALERLWPEGGKLGLAVSGGPDSLAMLLLAEAAIPGRFEVATVDHGLRAEAKNECALVARICADRDIPCAVLRVEVGEGNLQEQARDARYAALAAWAASGDLRAVATAHHADDQAETLLMRLNRGSGVAGLAGVRERAFLDPPYFELPLIRPLLTLRRTELASVIAAARVEVADDPSNLDDRFERVRLRKAIANADWLDPVALSRSASHLADANDALEEFAIVLWSQHVRREGDVVTFYPLAPRLMRLRIVERIIRELGGDPRGGDVARLLDRIEAGTPANVGGVLATVEGNQWAFRREPPRRNR